MPPAVVSITSLEYSGSLDLAIAKRRLVNYINSIEDGELQKSDLINTLYTAGATNVSTNIAIKVKQYKSDGSNTTYTLDSDTYTLPTGDVSRFYADTETLIGVTRV
jgi:glycosyltransferase A (GT-A) superfamily protein (DUF2064 family)